jgi:hypothetical protein
MGRDFRLQLEHPARMRDPERGEGPLRELPTSSISFPSCSFRALFTLRAPEFRRNTFLFFHFRTLSKNTGSGTLRPSLPEGKTMTHKSANPCFINDSPTP